jgi:hypothetical protein
MLRRIGRGRDPFWDDGVGARQRNRRVVVEGVVAFSLATVACGVTAALWFELLAPFVARFLPH